MSDMNAASNRRGWKLLRPGERPSWKVLATVSLGVFVALAAAMADVSLPERLLVAYREHLGGNLALAALQLDPRTHFDIPVGLPPLPKNFRPWPTYEKLSRVLEEQFWDARNTDCKRMLVHTTRHNAGFGSQFNNMLLGVAEALAANRTFVLGPSVMDGGYQCEVGAAGSAYQTCFNWTFIGPPSCDSNELRELAHGETWRLPFEDVDCQDHLNCAETEGTRVRETVRTPDDIEIIRANSVRRTKDGGAGEWMVGRGPVIGGEEVDWLAFKAYSARKVWSFTPGTQASIARRIQTLDVRPLADTDQSESSPLLRTVPPRPFCSIHVRKGDKIGGEAFAVPVVRYLDAFQEMDVSCRSYFLASDAIRSTKAQLQEELRQRHPPQGEPPLILTLDYSQGDPYADGGYHWSSFLSKQESGRVQNTIDLLTEFEIMRTADAFVGAYTSNVARLAMVLRAATGWGPETSRSVEGQEWSWL